MTSCSSDGCQVCKNGSCGPKKCSGGAVCIKGGACVIRKGGTCASSGTPCEPGTTCVQVFKCDGATICTPSSPDVSGCVGPCLFDSQVCAD
jgi:hypothetical protein